LAVELLEIGTSPLQAFQESCIYLPVRSIYVSGADAKIFYRHSVETLREFSHCRITALAHVFHNGLYLWQYALHIRCRALHHTLLRRGIECCQTLYLHGGLPP
jgi:hypothetical protein